LAIYSAIMASMIGKIDCFGRVVIPKGVRDRLGLHGGDSVEIMEQDGQIRIAALAEVKPIRRAEDGLLVLWAEPDSVEFDPVAASRESRLKEILGLPAK